MYDSILANVSRFATLNEEEKTYFISILQPKKLRKHQHLVQAGEQCRYECYVNKGCLRQYYVDDSGQEHIIMFAVEDWWISDMYGLVTGNPSLTNVDALEDAELLLIEKSNFEKLLKEVPKFERHFRIMLQRAFIAHQRRIIETMSLPAVQRYYRFLEQYPQLEQRLPKKLIASYLGITPESLSRIRSQYQKKG
jgi:CRP-like cAMP-binding protein